VSVRIRPIEYSWVSNQNQSLLTVQHYATNKIQRCAIEETNQFGICTSQRSYSRFKAKHACYSIDWNPSTFTQTPAWAAEHNAVHCAGWSSGDRPPIEYGERNHAAFSKGNTTQCGSHGRRVYFLRGSTLEGGENSGSYEQRVSQLLNMLQERRCCFASQVR
jgi:hypothetical protein